MDVVIATAYTRRPPNVWVSRLPARQPQSTSSDRRAFTFLQHEGVSWNNNLAENAIKRVSDYRENVRRSVKEAGLTEYLVLLSLYQTCRLRNVSFLKFLLSQERDMNAFTAGKRRSRRRPRVETYSKGYLPPSIILLRRGRTSPATADRE
jgi:hypothetical protein